MPVYTRSEFKHSVDRMLESILDFHERFGINWQLSEDPEDYPLQNLKDRLPLLIEELGEHAREISQSNYEKALDELVDVAYVVLGTLEIHRESTLLIDQVATKNNNKTLKTHYKSESGKILKVGETDAF